VTTDPRRWGRGVLQIQPAWDTLSQAKAALAEYIEIPNSESSGRLSGRLTRVLHDERGNGPHRLLSNVPSTWRHKGRGRHGRKRYGFCL